MEVLLGGLPLDRSRPSMTINSPAAPIWAMYIVAAEKAGVPRDRSRARPRTTSSRSSSPRRSSCSRPSRRCAS
jgi:methylmalonyl-CoA mutase N-terminal domain/subunit